MSKLRNIFILLAFVFWILPLGVFIKAVDEKKFCDGQRAICLCSHVGKGKTSTAKKILMAHTPSSEKETSPSGGSNHFLNTNFKDINALASSKLFNYTPNLYSLIVCKSVEHVPKA